MSNFAYFYGKETEQYQFYRIPQVLFTNEYFKDLSCMAKVLYGFLLDRTNLSLKNNFRDNDRIYVFFTHEEAQEMLGIGHNKAVKIFSELEETGLIIRKKQGQGKPTKIFVMNFAKNLCPKGAEVKDKNQTSPDTSVKEVQTSQNRKSEKISEKKREVKTSEKRKSRIPKSGNQDFRKKDAINTYVNQTDISQTNLSSVNQSSVEKEKSEQYRKSVGMNDRRTDDFRAALDKRVLDEQTGRVKEQIEYDVLCSQTEWLSGLGIDKSLLDLTVSVMAEVYALNASGYTNASVTVKGVKIPVAVAAARFEKLDSEQLLYTLGQCVEASKTQKIYNTRSYLLSSLYNSAFTADVGTAFDLNYHGFGSVRSQENENQRTSYDIEKLNKINTLDDIGL